MKAVKYMVTNAFGMSPEGEIRTAFIVNSDTDTNKVLLFHPSEDKEFCGSVEIAVSKLIYPKDSTTGVTVYVSYGDDAYLNLPDAENKRYLAMINKTKKSLIKKKKK